MKTVNDKFTFCIDSIANSIPEFLSRIEKDINDALNNKIEELELDKEEVLVTYIDYAYEEGYSTTYEIHITRPQTEKEILIEQKNKAKALIDKQNKEKEEKEEWELYTKLKKKFEGGDNV
jgi:hypothetical protein